MDFEKAVGIMRSFRTFREERLKKLMGLYYAAYFAPIVDLLPFFVAALVLVAILLAYFSNRERNKMPGLP
jgi:hypothetical protein